MSKNQSDKLVIVYILKAVLSTVAALLLFSSFAAYLIYKLDLSVSSAQIFSVFVYLLTAITVCVISVYGLKNSGALMGVLSQLPLILYSVFNLIFNENTLVLFLVKLALSILCGALFGLLMTKRSKRFKV